MAIFRTPVSPMAAAIQQILAAQGRPTSNVPPVQLTQLPPADEAKYAAWMQAIGHTPQAGYNVMPDVQGRLTGTDYDYRGFFKKNGPVPIGKDQHLTDEFKLPNHPTYSVESQYAQGPYKRSAGKWIGEQYVPSRAR